jgi:hypothetical protein
MAREKQINFKVTPDEAKRFDRVAAHFGIPLAATIRMLVKEKDDALGATRKMNPTRIRRSVG